MKSFFRYLYLATLLIASATVFFAYHKYATHPWIQVVSYGGPAFFLLGLLGLGWVAPKGRLDLVAWFGMVIIFSSKSVISLIPWQSEQLDPIDGDIKIISLNAAQLSFTNDNPGKLAQDILKEDPDIVLLQEIGIRKNWQQKDSIEKVLLNAFGMKYMSFSRQKDNIYGFAIFSNLPIDEAHELILTKSNMNGAVGYVLHEQGHKIHVVNCHLNSFNLVNEIREGDYDFHLVVEEQHRQAQLIHDYVRNSPVSTVMLAGDLNAPPYTKTYLMLSQGHKDAFLEAGRGYGSSMANLLLPYRIDVQLHNELLKCIDFESVHTRWSDHRMQIGIYRWIDD